MSRRHFDDDHEPRRRFPAGKMYPTLPGWFPTKKAPGGKIRTRLPLMSDGLVHIDTDPACVRISPYPLSIRFFAHGSDGRFKVVQHIPDIGAKMDDGSEVYIDFVPVNIQAEHPDFQRWENELRQAFREQYGASYAVHDELCIYIKPVRRQVFWDNRLFELTEALVHQGYHFMLPPLGEASGVV